MARPERNNVDYFPFYCEDGNKMFYLEETYGNDGFATFIKLLRELAKTDYHYLNLSKPSTMMYLSAKCKVTKEVLESIINDLVELGKFDEVLWKENKIVWCNDFIESIQDAYKKRNNKCITLDGLLHLLNSLGVRKLGLGVSKGDVNTQRKEEERKEEERKEEERKEEDILLKKETKNNNKFSFRKNLIEYGFQENLVDDWLKVRKTKKATNTETAFKSFITEIESRNCNINDMLQMAVTNSWSGFKHKWVDNLKNIDTNGGKNNNSSETNSGHKESAISAVSAMFGK
jgi:hypothetical protein